MTTAYIFIALAMAFVACVVIGVAGLAVGVWLEVIEKHRSK